MSESKSKFIFGTTLFFLFIVQIGGLIGTDIINNFDASFEVTYTGNPWLDTFTFAFNNFGVFFTLMTVSSEFFLFGTVIIGAYIVTLLYIAIELGRGI